MVIAVQGSQRSGRRQMLLVVLRIVLLSDLKHLMSWGVLLGMSLRWNLRMWLGKSISTSLRWVKHVLKVLSLVTCLLLNGHKLIIWSLLLRDYLDLGLINDSWILRVRSLVLLASKVWNHVHSLSFFSLVHYLATCYVYVLLSWWLLFLTFVAIN